MNKVTHAQVSLVLIAFALVLGGCDSNIGHALHYDGYQLLESDGIVDTFLADETTGDNREDWNKIWLVNIDSKETFLRLDTITENNMPQLGMKLSNDTPEMRFYSNEGLAHAGFVNGTLKYVYLGRDSPILFNNKAATTGIRLPCKLQSLTLNLGEPNRTERIHRSTSSP